MKYLGKKFSSPANSKEFVDNWAAAFGIEQPVETKNEQVKESGDEKQER